MTDGFEHGATMILGIELCEGGYLAGEQEVEVLLGDFGNHCSCCLLLHQHLRPFGYVIGVLLEDLTIDRAIEELR